MGEIIGYAVWTVLSFIFVGLGIADFFAIKPVGFWANAKTGEISDVKSYNRAVGKLFIIYGVILWLLGMPLLAGQNSALILLTVLGVMLETIVMMAVYILVIEKKYRK